jgi:hypothetical protein
MGCWTRLLGFWVRRRSWTCCSKACMRLRRQVRSLRGVLQLMGAYESRFAELSRRRAGRKTHVFLSRAHLSTVNSTSITSSQAPPTCHRCRSFVYDRIGS